MAIKCPKCNSTIYSRMASACPNCHEPLPNELLPTGEDVAKRKKDDLKMKQWLKEEDYEKDQKRNKDFDTTGRNIFNWLSG